MTDQPNPELDHSVNPTAMSLYGQDDAMDDFPVLKAFQQYVDSEQAKARKRLISLGIFFGILMGAVIAVFLVILFNITERNQSLNDRLIEFAMKDRNRTEGPVVVQPPVQQDNAAILQLTSKIEAMQNKLIESQKRADEAERAQKAAAEAAAAALAPKAPSPQELEIERLKALLNAEKEKAAAEKAKLKEAELEAYRRKHYPECYVQPQPVTVRKQTVRKATVVDDEEDEDLVKSVKRQSRTLKGKAASVDPQEVLKGKAIKYFDDDENEDDEVEMTSSAPRTSKLPKVEEKKPETVKQPESTVKSPSSQSATETPPAAAKEDKPDYSIPVEVRGKKSSWRLPD